MQYPHWTQTYFERIRPTFLESWSAELAALSIPHVGVQLCAGEAEALLTLPSIWRDRLTPNDPIGLHTLAVKLESRINLFADGAFIRLGSGSPKDSDLFQHNRGRVQQATMAIKFLQTSLRARAHLLRCLELDYLPSVFVRQWLPLQPWQEFRCFMRDRQLIGVSQLDCVNEAVYPELLHNADQIEQAIRTAFLTFRACCHLEKVVFDVFVVPDSEVPGSYQAKLTEINPWVSGIGTGLFRRGIADDFDGSFRYLK